MIWLTDRRLMDWTITSVHVSFHRAMELERHVVLELTL
jgi:hypothetical protein